MSTFKKVMYAIMNCGVAALLIFCGVSFAGAASVVALYAMGVYFIISGFRWFISDGKDPNRTGYQTESIKMSIIFAAISWGLAALCFWLAKGIADYENMLGLAVAGIYHYRYIAFPRLSQRALYKIRPPRFVYPRHLLPHRLHSRGRSCFSESFCSDCKRRGDRRLSVGGSRCSGFCYVDSPFRFHYQRKLIPAHERAFYGRNRFLPFFYFYGSWVEFRQNTAFNAPRDYAAIPVLSYKAQKTPLKR